MNNNQTFWNTEGTRKTFTHTLFPEWLAEIDKESAVLDYGCGYGRLIPELRTLGFQNIQGYDTSAPIIKRARIENPQASYCDQLDELHDQLFGLVTCFAVFTCCPKDTEQRQTVTNIEQLTEPGSILYISDYLMDDNPHYAERYAQNVDGIEGCFISGEASFRHHSAAHFEKILSNWQLLTHRSQAGKTMNGNDITFHQYLFRRA